MLQWIGFEKIGRSPELSIFDCALSISKAEGCVMENEFLDVRKKSANQKTECARKTKILIVDQNPFSKTANPYIREIVRGVLAQKNDFEFFFGIENFWSEKVFDFDIIHFMYCHLVLQKKRTVKDLKARFEKIKTHEKKIAIVATCHNFSAHYSDKKENAYEAVYKNCEHIYHLWNYSLEVAAQRFPNAKHFILEHPAYQNEFKDFAAKDEALNFLKLKKQKKYVLCMGAFRSKEERLFIIKIARRLKKNDFAILAPSFCHFSFRRNFFILFFNALKFVFVFLAGKIFFPNLIFAKKHCKKFVRSEDFKYFYGAADLCFIQRLKILNSGNVYVAFHFGKPVCGPDVGNVGSFLNYTNNVTFDAKNPMSAIVAIQKTYELSKTNLGSKNRAYAMENLSVKKIGKKQCEFYKMLIKK